MKVDTLAGLSLITTATLVFHGLVVLLFPIAVFSLGRLQNAIATTLRFKSSLPSLPRDIKQKISAVVPVPRNVFFLRGSGNDCKSVSLFFVHAVLLPLRFEKNLEDSNKQSELLHEFSHADFSDYLVVYWVWITGVFAALTAFDYYRGGNNSSLIGELPVAESAMLAAIFLCILNGRGMFHRREINADFGAFHVDPQMFSTFLRKRSHASKYHKTGKLQFDVVFSNWLYHPSHKTRFSIISDKQKISLFSVAFAGVLAGFFPAFIAMNVFGSLFTSISLRATGGSIVSIPLSLLSAWLIASITSKFFGKVSPANLAEKSSFWAGLLVGTEAIVFLALLVSNSEANGGFSFLATNGVLVEVSLRTSFFVIFAGYIFLAFYLALFTRFFSQMFTSILAMPLASIVFFALTEGYQMTEGASLDTLLWLTCGGIVFSVIVLLVFEAAFQLIHRIMMRIYRSAYRVIQSSF